MMDCRKLDFSLELAATRMEAAKQAFGEATFKRLVAFMLFVLGGNRARISEEVNMPPGTVRSLTRRVLTDGIKGFMDLRRKPVPALVASIQPQATPIVSLSPDTGTLHIGGRPLCLPESNPIQRKVVLLSLIGKEMLSTEETAAALGLSVSHTRKLHRDLMGGDVEAVIDKRRGQLQDYRVDPKLKGQMIVQFVLELAENGRTSSAAVARRLEQDCSENVPDRTIRHHLNRLGLSNMKESLIAGLQIAKKNSAH